MAALENRRRGRGARPRWVDNQSTESSFHTHKFKADGGVTPCWGGGFDFIWQLQTPSPFVKKRVRSMRRALPQNQYRHKERGDRDKGSAGCGELKKKTGREAGRGE